VPGTLQAVGNTWQPSVQGADAAGHYVPGTEVVSADPGAHGANFDLVAGGSTVEL
jgi:hypothetical protein